MLSLQNYIVFQKNIEGYQGLVKKFPILSRALSSAGRKILNLIRTFTPGMGKAKEDIFLLTTL
jgi:hypothetical protein